MTILGKMLLFLVLVLSLVWTGLTVNAYVTRTNWASEARKWKEQAEAAKQSAEYQRRLAEDTRNAAAAQIANLSNEITALQAARDTLTREYAAASQQAKQILEASQQGDPGAKLLQANIAKLEKQVDLLQASLNEMEKIVNDATVIAERAKGDAQRASIDREAALKARDELQQRLFDLSDQLQAIRTGRTGTAARLAPPDDFRATVTRVNGDLVEINLGANAGLQRGATLSIFRTTPAPKYLGTLTVTRVDPHVAVGQYIPPAGVARPSPGDRPQEGDTVGVIKQ
jgi:uncharacterized phage infection (PIP) family protein YhgE